MPTPHPHRRRVLFVATVVAAAFTVGMLPPAFGDETPPTAIEEIDVAASTLANPGQEVQAAGGTLRSEDGGWTRSHRVCGDITFTSAAVAWRQSGGHDAEDDHGGHGVHVTMRWGDEDSLGPAFRTVALADEMPDPGEGDGFVATPVVWTDEARCLEVRLEVPDDAGLRNIEVTLINASGTASRHTVLGSLAAGLREAMGRIWGMETAAATAPKPKLITRKGWGANESKRRCTPDTAPRLKMAFVHHTVNGNSYSRSQADDLMRSIYAYHTDGRGYCDIAYNFLIDRFGRIYVGRRGSVSTAVVGGHAMGFNTGSTGVAVIGDFTSRTPPSSVMQALKKLLAWRLDVEHLRPTGRTTMVSAGGSSQKYKKGQKVKLPIISGHRQTGYTACPGDRLWARMGAIRTSAERRGMPKIWKPRANRDTIQVGAQTVSYQARLSSSLLWKIKVRDENGNIVRGTKARGMRVRWTWNGRLGNGVPVPPGDYRVTIATKKGSSRARTAVLTTTVTA